MVKKNLNEKVLDVIFWTCIFLVTYLIVGFLLDSEWLSKGLTFDESYNLLKDALGITAAFLAPVVAFILFSDWREQHNKQVRNEFALKVFNQFEKFEKEIQRANFISIEMWSLVPEESMMQLGSERIPIYLNDHIFEMNRDLILSFPKQIEIMQEDFNYLLDTLRNFAVVINQVDAIHPFMMSILEDFEKTHDDESDSYSEYLQLLYMNDEKLRKYTGIRDRLSKVIRRNILQQLQA